MNKNTPERILIVDDSLEMRNFISNVLTTEAGYSVSVARSGHEGVEITIQESPDLIITDYSMPEMSGLEMLEELRRREQTMPAILMTAEGSEDIAVRALRAGVMDYFVKPFDPFEMKEAATRVLAASRIGATRTSVSDQRNMQALNALIAVGRSVTALLDLESILTRIVEAAVFISGAEEGTLMLLDRTTGDLYVRASKNIEEGLRSMRLRVVDSLAGKVVSSGDPLYVEGGTPQKIKTSYLVRSLIYVPLKVADRVIGVLGVHNRSGASPLGKDILASMTALADYASIAIVNAELYSEADSERARFSKILNQIQDGVLLVDGHDRVALCNPVARDLLDQAGNDFIGQRLVNLTSNRQLLDLLEDSKNRTTRPLHGDVSHSGKIFNAHVSEIPGLGRAVVMQDITELKELDRIKSELVLMVSHDLRSPLTAILSYTELMGRVGELNEQQKEFTKQARISVESITTLINDLLDLGKIEARVDREREEVDMGELAGQAVRIVKQQAELKKQIITVNTREGVPTVMGNALQLRQVFTNLLDNAIKYSGVGGAIGLHLFGEAESVIVVISDDGIGISPEDQPHIFDRFYRVKEVTQTHTGTGLGLNIVKSIVDLHSGRVWVQSTPGKGTTFTIVLPAFTASNLEQEAITNA